MPDVARTPLEGDVSLRSTRPGRSILLGLIALIGLSGIVGWLVGHHGLRTDNGPDMGPVVMAMQKLGQLHSLSMTMKDVIHQDTDSPPSGWLSDVPAADTLAHWATHNQALVVAEGRVEAGLDLSRIREKDIEKVRLPDGTVHLRVHLPPVEIYPPNVQVTVEEHRPGLFWRDDNIVPKAQAEASRRFLQAAEQADIRDRARVSAIETLRKLTGALGFRDVEFTVTPALGLAVSDGPKLRTTAP